MVIFQDPVNIKGYWVQVKTEFTNPDGSTHEDEYKVGNHWMMTEDSIFEMVYPNYVCYATEYMNVSKYGIRCSTPTYNNIQNANYRGDTLILGGNNEMNIEHEYFLVKSKINGDAINDLVAKRINWKSYFGSWEFKRACYEFDMLEEVDKEEVNLEVPSFLFINEKSVFSLDTLKYYDTYMKQSFSLRFIDPLRIHNTTPQLLFEYNPTTEDEAIILQYQVADTILQPN